MRVIAELPHPQMKITLFHWNAKYIIKIEIGQFEQVFKISELEISGVEELKKLLNEDFMESVMERFLSMREDFSLSLQKLQS